MPNKKLSKPRFREPTFDHIMIKSRFAESRVKALGGLLLAIPALVAIIFIKSKNSRNITKVETNEVYGTYDLTGEMSDYNTVEDTNDYYGR